MTDTAEKTLDALAIRKLSTGYAPAKILHSAVELGVFEYLAGGAADEATLREGLGLHQRLTRQFLDALVALGLLDRDGDRYANSAPAAEVLLPGGKVYVGARIRANSERHYHVWGRLSEALRDGGLPQGPTPFDELYTDVDKARAFLIHMDANNGLVAPQLAAEVDWSRHRTFGDVGGARGNVAANLVKIQPHLQGGVFELPPVEPLFDELMAESGTTGQVTFHPGNFFTDPLPETDVLIFGHVLHDWTVEQRIDLLRRAAAAVPVGGLVVVYDQMLDELNPALDTLLGSLNVALMTPGGSEYNAADCRSWIAETGLTTVKVKKLDKGNDTVLVARR